MYEVVHNSRVVRIFYGGICKTYAYEFCADTLYHGMI